MLYHHTNKVVPSLPLPFFNEKKIRIVSGLFWVPGAACGIYAIRTAGISAAVGLWSSIQGKNGSLRYLLLLARICPHFFSRLLSFVFE